MFDELLNTFLSAIYLVAAYKVFFNFAAFLMKIAKQMYEQEVQAFFWSLSRGVAQPG